MSDPVWLYCEVCGAPMAWGATLGKYNPTTGAPEWRSYYRCSRNPEHMPIGTDPGGVTTWIDGKPVRVVVPDRPPGSHDAAPRLSAR